MIHFIDERAIEANLSKKIRIIFNNSMKSLQGACPPPIFYL